MQYRAHDQHLGELWSNADYLALVLRDCTTVAIAAAEVLVTRIEVIRRDRTEIRDWRDLQRIKNDVVGPEHEAVELFPAESRLIDSANRYYLWCFPLGSVAIGMYGERRVWGPEQSPVAQRAFS